MGSRIRSASVAPLPTIVRLPGVGHDWHRRSQSGQRGRSALNDLPMTAELLSIP